MVAEKVIVITGAGGFVGGHLVSAFRQAGGYRIRAADIRPLDEWYQVFHDVEDHPGH